MSLSDSKVNIGLVGATGLVGTMMRSVLAERNFPIGEFRCFAWTATLFVVVVCRAFAVLCAV